MGLGKIIKKSFGVMSGPKPPKKSGGMRGFLLNMVKNRPGTIQSASSGGRGLGQSIQDVVRRRGA